MAARYPEGMVIAQLLALAASLSGAAEFVFPAALGSGGRFVVVTDHPPVWTAAGTPAFPPGTTLEVRADGRAGPLVVHLVAPTELTDVKSCHTWRKTFVRPGGYMLEYGSELGMSGLSDFHFVISENPQDQPQTGAMLP